MPELVRETDPDVLLALSAVNQEMMELRNAQSKRDAQLIAFELAKVLAQIWK